MRRKFIAGNWKMHMGPKSASLYIKQFVKELNNRKTLEDALNAGTIAAALFVPSISLTSAQAAKGNCKFIVGAENVHSEKKGAFTGEISVPMLLEADTFYVIIGHSERRRIFMESDDLINKKILNATGNGLTVIFCIGETLSERESGMTYDVLKNQLRNGLASVGKGSIDAGKIIIAYEPVWAIGTGVSASTADAEKACKYIRAEFAKMFTPSAADNELILYGGSVKPENSREILNCDNIDGVLAGGASLEVDSFVKILEAAL